MFRCIYMYMSINLVFSNQYHQTFSKHFQYMNTLYMYVIKTNERANYLFSRKRNCYCFKNVNWQYSTVRYFIILCFSITNLYFLGGGGRFSIWNQPFTKMYSAIQCCTLKIKQVFTAFVLWWIPLKLSCLFLVWLY